jgi:8-oxo-dGTP pyrophosphatase MutT (NUDIX family)
LPGEKAQMIMGSGIRLKELRFMPVNENTKKSGVMILLYPAENTIYSVLILRTKYNGTHSGQVALPGGKAEISDKDLVETALRETHEEIGIDRADIHVVGQITRLYIPPSNYIVFPTVGYMTKKPSFVPDPTEVKDIIEYPLATLLDEKTVKTKPFKINDEITFTAPYFDIGGNVVWGATAMILSEFKEILRSI